MKSCKVRYKLCIKYTIGTIKVAKKCFILCHLSAMWAYCDYPFSEVSCGHIFLGQ